MALTVQVYILLSIFVVSAWFPDHFTGTYLASILLYSPTIRRITLNKDTAALVALFSAFYILPYVLVVSNANPYTVQIAVGLIQKFVVMKLEILCV